MIASLRGDDLRIAAHWLALIRRVFVRPPVVIGDLVLFCTLLNEVTQAIRPPAPDPLVVVRLRYGLDGSKPMSIHEVAMSLGFTRERIRHTENEVIRRLQYPSYSKPLYASFFVESEPERSNLKLS